MSQSPQNPLIQQALDALQDSSCSPDSDQFDPVLSLLQNTDIFRKSIGSSSALKNFYKLARWHLNYEVHQYGTVLIKEHDYADKLYILLQGKIERLQQKGTSNNTEESPETLKKESPVQLDSTFKRLKIATSRVSSFMSFNHTSQDSGSLLDASSIHNDSAKYHLKAPSRRGSFKIDSDVSLNELDLDSGIKSVKLAQDNSLSSVNDQSTHWSKAKSSFQSKTNPQTKSSRFFHQSKRSFRFSQPTFILSPSHQNTREFDQENIEEEEETLAKGHRDRQSVAFVRLLASKDPELEQRCFHKNLSKVFSSKIYAPGDYFGENFCRHHQAKEKAIIAVASGEAHVLTISRQSYKSILAEVESQAQAKTLFFSQVFTPFGQRLIVRFSKYFTEKSFQKGEVVYTQNDSINAMYFVSSGEIKLSKENNIPLQKSPSMAGSNLSFTKPQKKIELPIAIIGEKQAFGEEILNCELQRHYTATANVPNTKVYVLSLQVYEKIKERYEDIFDYLRGQASGKSEWRQERISGLTDSKVLDSSRLPNRSLTMIAPPSQTHIACEEDVKNVTSLMRRTAFNDKKPATMIKKVLSPEAVEAYWTKFSRLPQTAATNRKTGETPRPPQQIAKSNSQGNLQLSPVKSHSMVDNFSVIKELKIAPIKPTKPQEEAPTTTPSQQVKRPVLKGFSFIEMIATGRNSANHMKSPSSQKKKNNNNSSMNSLQKITKYSYLSTNLIGNTGGLMAGATKTTKGGTPIVRLKIGFGPNPMNNSLLLSPSESKIKPFAKAEESDTRTSSQKRPRKNLSVIV